jgi:succinoglycan biosynthesis protein ExoA
VRRCVEVLLETGAANVGGRMVPVGTTQFGRAVAAVTTSPLGVGPGRFHYSTEREEVDTVYLGCWRRGTLLELGGYDEHDLQWAAEDQELNLRIRQSGGIVLLDPSIRSWYFPRDRIRPLAKQYANYGMAKASTLRKHGRLPTWRPLAPAMLVVASAFGIVVGRRAARVAVPVAHAAVVCVAATRLAEAPGVAPHRAIAATLVCHWTYGFGFLRGIGRILSGRSFDQRPRRGR